MPVRLRFEFFGEEQVNRSLLAIDDRARDMRPAWDALRDRFVAYEADWFDSEGRGDWPPLSRDYAAWKARHYPGKPILRRDDTLYDSVTRPDIDVREPAFAVFGTGDPVAVYHQRGTDRMPARRVIDLDEDERRQWVKTVQAYLIGEDL